MRFVEWKYRDLVQEQLCSVSVDFTCSGNPLFDVFVYSIVQSSTRYGHSLCDHGENVDAYTIELPAAVRDINYHSPKAV